MWGWGRVVGMGRKVVGMGPCVYSSMNVLITVKDLSKPGTWFYAMKPWKFNLYEFQIETGLSDGIIISKIVEDSPANRSLLRVHDRVMSVSLQSTCHVVVILVQHFSPVLALFWFCRLILKICSFGKVPLVICILLEAILGGLNERIIQPTLQDQSVLWHDNESLRYRAVSHL